MTSIGERAFYDCTSMKSITIPRNANIGLSALGVYGTEDNYYNTMSDFTIFCYKQRYVEPQPWEPGGWVNTAAYSYVTVNYELKHVFLDEANAYGMVFGGDGIGLEGAEIFFRDSDNKATPAEVTGSTYIAGVAPGEYTVTVSKDGYAPREYTVTVGDEPVELDVEIHKYGDINGSGEIDAKDIAKAIDVSKGNSTFRDDYDRVVADVDGKTGFSAGDTAAFIAHGKGVKVIG